MISEEQLKEYEEAAQRAKTALLEARKHSNTLSSDMAISAVFDLSAEIRALRKIKDAGDILLSSLCENHRDVHGMLELEASIADYERGEVKE